MPEVREDCLLSHRSGVVPSRDGSCCGHLRVGESCLIETIDIAVLVVALSGNIIYCNPRASELLENKTELLRNQPVDRVFAPMSAIAAAAAETSNDETRRTTRLVRRDGSEVLYGFRAKRIDQLDGTCQFVVIFQDVTRWESLRKQRDRALQLAVVGDILPTLLNELKNPLAAVVTAVEILFEEAGVEPIQRDLHAILGELRRMKMVLEGIGSSGRPVHHARHEAIDLGIWEALRVLELQAKDRKLQLVSDVPAMPLLPLDAAIIRGLLFNLVQNAQHASQPGSVVEVKVWLDPDSMLCIRVTDRGSGMTPEQLAQCRELFYSTKPHGTGLGLTICQRVADEARGSLEIVSKLRQGTEVTLRLPTEPPYPRGDI